MFTGWFSGNATAPTDAAAPGATQEPNQSVEGQSDSDGEFVVVDGGVGYSTSTRGVNSVIQDRVPSNDEVDEQTAAEVSKDEKKTPDEAPAAQEEGVADEVLPEETKEDEEADAEPSTMCIETTPCPASRPGATFAHASSTTSLPIPPKEEELVETDTEVDTLVDEEPKEEQDHAAPVVDSCDDDEEEEEEAQEEEEEAPLPVVEDEDTNAKWVDVRSKAAFMPAPLEKGDFEECHSAPHSQAVITDTAAAASSSAVAVASSTTSPQSVVYPWGCPGVKIIIADVDVAEQELLSEIFNSGDHRRLALETVQAAQCDEELTPSQRQCLSVLIPPACTEKDACTFVCWNMGHALVLVERKLDAKKVTATTPNDVRELMVLHSLLSRVSPTPNPAHHVAIAALLIRQAQLEEGGVMEAAPILRQLRKAVDEGFNELELLCGDERFASLHGFTEFDGFIADALVDWEPVLKVQSLLGKRGSNSIKICDIMAHLFYANGDADRAAKSLHDLYF